MQSSKDFHEFFNEADITILDDEPVLSIHHIDASVFGVGLVQIRFRDISDNDYYYVVGSGCQITNDDVRFVMYTRASRAATGVSPLIMTPEFYKKMKF